MGPLERKRRRGRPPRTGPPAAALVALAAGLAASCGESTAPEDRPRRLVRASAAADSAGIGDTVASALAVRVESSGGEPVPGVGVRFRVVNDAPGRPTARFDTTRRDGTARTRFAAGDRIGAALVRAGLPSHPGVEPVRFTMRTTVPRRTRLFAVSGDGQRAETASQLPRPLVVRVTTPDGVPAGGVPVFWRVSSAAGPGARLSADTAFTDGEGRSRALLALGSEPGEYRVAARSAGADSAARFAATAVDSLGSELRLDSVRPRPLRAGETAELFGSGFAAAGTGLRVWIGGEEAGVLEGGGGRLRVRTPAFAGRCLPARTAGVRVIDGGTQSNGRTVRLLPAEDFVNLEVGGSRVLTAAAELDCLQFEADASGREYRLGVQSAARAEALTPVRLLGRNGEDVGAGGTAADPVPVRLSGAERPVPARARARGAAGAELRLLRAAAREALERADARPVDRPEGRGGRSRLADRADGTPDPGDRRTFLLSVDPDELSVDCTDTTAVVDAVARAVGDDVVLYEDTAAPVRGFSESDFRGLLGEFETTTFPVDTAYFGAPVDVDGNGRVAVLFTPEVNELSAPGRDAFVGGFFLPTDLAESGRDGGEGSGAGGVCPVSNEAEVIYLPVPDRFGAFGQVVERRRALGNARSVTAHEMEHLLSAEQRVFRTPVAGSENPFDDLESAWLAEGLAHLAEEVVGLARTGLRERQNLGFPEAAGDAADFEAFHVDNFSRARLFLRDPSGVPALAGSDPGGRGSFQMRGFGWLFARFLGDQVGPDGTSGPVGGSDEHRLFRELSRGGDERATGVENVLRASRAVGRQGRAWRRLLADFGVAVAADDDPASLDPGRSLRTWDLRDVFAGLHRNRPREFEEPYPLRAPPLAFATTAVDFELGPSTAAYFGLSSDSASAAYSVRVGTPDGSRLPASARPQVLLVRVR